MPPGGTGGGSGGAVSGEGSSSNTVQKTGVTRGGTKIYKIVVLGEGGVGKSALTLQFVSHSFLEYHDPTIEDAYQQQAVIDGEPALLDILDTAGQVEFTAMRDQYMRCGEGFIVCYSITDRRSFEEVIGYTATIDKVRASNSCPAILVANKVDLEEQRKVSTEEGLILAQSLGWPFFETSAALRLCVDDVFHSIVRAIRCRQKGIDPPLCGVAEGLAVAGRDGRNGKVSRWKRFKSFFISLFRRNR